MSKATLPTQKKAYDTCPNCGSNQTRILKTNSTTIGIALRYHECANCGQRFKTEG